MVRTVNQPGIFGQTECIQPVVIAFIDFGDGTGTRIYGTKDNQPDWDGRILEVGQIVSQAKLGNTGMVSTMSLTLDDSDDFAKQAIDFANAFKATAKVQAYYEGIAGDGTTIFEGKIVNPIAWSEGTRIIQLNIESAITSGEIGYAIQDGDFAINNEVGVGKVWPTCFGKPAHVPAPLVTRAAQTTLIKPVGFINIENPGDLLIERSARIMGTVTFNTSQLRDLRKMNQLGMVTGALENTIEVESQEGFPDGEIEISIEGVIFKGSFDGMNVFTVTEANARKFDSVLLIDRVQDIDESNPNVFYISDASQILIGSYLYFRRNDNNSQMYSSGDEDTIVRRVVNQIGNKCYLEFPIQGLLNAGGDRNLIKLDSSFTIDEVRGLPPNGMTIYRGDVDKTLQSNVQWRARAKEQRKETSQQTGTNIDNPFGSWDAEWAAVDTYVNLFWRRNPGAVVKLWSGGNVDDVYVANALESISVNAVYGIRTFKNEAGDDIPRLVPIPKSYYTINLAEATGITQVPIATTIRFKNPLVEYMHQNWSEDIYVTLTSTIGDNTVDQIEFILDNYTNLITDTTFASVRSSVANKPSNWALLEKWDGLTLAENVAWQCLCVLIVELDEVSIKNLSLDPPVTITVNDPAVQFKTIEKGFTDFNDIVTKLIGIWRPTYAPILDDDPRSREFRIATYEENVDIYGQIEREYDFFIYNGSDLVNDSLEFWGHRYANIWNTLTYVGYQQFLGQQIYDTPIHTFSDPIILRTINLKGTFTRLSHDIMNTKTTVHTWLPVVAGKVTEDSNAWR